MSATATNPQGRPSDSMGLAKDTRGLTTVEYIIVLVLIAVGAIGLWTKFGGSLNSHTDTSTVRIRDMNGADTGQSQSATNSNNNSNTPSNSNNSNSQNAANPAQPSGQTPKASGGKVIDD